MQASCVDFWGQVCYYVIVMNKYQNLTVTRNGEIDESFYIAQARRERLQELADLGVDTLRGIGRIAAQIGSKAVRETERAVFLIHLDLYDHAHGTNLRAEYFHRKQAAEISDLRAQF